LWPYLRIGDERFLRLANFGSRLYRHDHPSRDPERRDRKGQIHELANQSVSLLVRELWKNVLSNNVAKEQQENTKGNPADTCDLPNGLK